MNTIQAVEGREFNIKVNDTFFPLPKLGEAWNSYTSTRKQRIGDLMDGLLRDGSMTSLAIAASEVLNSGDIPQFRTGNLFCIQFAIGFMEKMAGRVLEQAFFTPPFRLRLNQAQTWDLAGLLLKSKPRLILGVARGYPGLHVPDAIDLHKEPDNCDVFRVWRFKKEKIDDDPVSSDPQALFGKFVRDPFFYQEDGSVEIQRILSEIVPNFPNVPVRAIREIEVKYVTFQRNSQGTGGDLEVPITRNVHIWLSDVLARELMGMSGSIREVVGH